MSGTENGYNPDYDPSGIEGGVDANALPWIPFPGLRQVYVKPLRTGNEDGMFSVILKIEKGAGLPRCVYLGGMDMLVLAGELAYEQNGRSSILRPGTWGYWPADSRVDSLLARDDSELLLNCYNAIALLADDGTVGSIFTKSHLRMLARIRKITLVPSTLAACAEPRPVEAADAGEALAINSPAARRALIEMPAGRSADSAGLRHPNLVDTRRIPWTSAAGLPDIAFKILRISEETQFVTLITKHNGVAPPHTHIGSADFLVLSGRIGYRAGPPEGYGPGVWFYEPAGARHDATQRVTGEDLIYTANLYGPVVFDAGRGTAPTAVLSWMEYKALAEAAGTTLVHSPNSDDSTLLAWTRHEA